MVIAMEDVAIRLRPTDNVAVATRHLEAGIELGLGKKVLQLVDSIRFGHKLAVEAIAPEEAVRKYGQIIGFASRPIEPGQHVHVHNVSCPKYDRDYAFASEVPPPLPATEERFFDGYLREDGKVGTRNYLVLISSVNCSATVCRQIVERFSGEALRAYPNVDGVIALTHKAGCAMAASCIDRDHLHRIATGIARHPNVFDYILVGLGCEVNQPDELVELHGLSSRTASKPRVISIQALGGMANAVTAGVRAVTEMLPQANQARRSRQPARKLILGTQCGGSDGNSGITANPAVGIAADLFVAQGGTVILSETTEIYGAEHLLTRRAVSRKIGQKLLERIKWWEWYTGVFGAEINNNPSQGNKEGGLTTIYEKSLGAIAKGGSTALVDVYEYAEPVTSPGLVVMDSPGFDPASITGMTAAGANLVVFTTGRGSASGSKPTPTLKVASNTPLFEHMQSEMDMNAGGILSGTPVEQVGREIFERLLATASGQRTKSELNGSGEEEFVPWTVGPML